MTVLTKKEKEELKKAAHSRSLRRSFAGMRSRARRLIKPLSLDEYIEFATYMNELAGHKPKKFEKMTGRHFKL